MEACEPPRRLLVTTRETNESYLRGKGVPPYIALLARVEAPGTRLTYREREVLALMAEGRSNSAIAQRLFVTEKAVTKHSTSIFAKLGLPPSEDDNRRVLAVLAYLNA